MVRKYCIVPLCTNSSEKTPDKLFFNVPKKDEIRKKWLKATRRTDPLKVTSSIHCCEDHFDVENDMDNYVKYKLVGGRLKLKEGVVPHKFACQKQLNETPVRSLIEKDKKDEIIKKIRSEDIRVDVASTSYNIEHTIDVHIVNSTEVEEDPLKDATVDDNLDYTRDKSVKKQHKKIQVDIKKKVHHKGTTTDDKLFLCACKQK
ncbi:unnamed protein product [Parnassius mnemosyne]|uniref:THAP-type domain-containing protein n=1 Tax=Parnassius mnemosyne TaxID=213953 RepID=A0AAV1M4Z0_9NEOP